jgi:Phage integrase family
VTPHVLRHSFASIANDLGFTEVTIAALVGHAKGSVTSKYIHTLDTALIMAADTPATFKACLTALSSGRPPMRWTAIHEKLPWPVS